MLLRCATFNSLNRGVSKGGGTLKWIGLTDSMLSGSILSNLPSVDAGAPTGDAEEDRFLFCPEVDGF